MEPTHTELLLCQAEASLNRAMNPSLSDDLRTTLAMTSCAASLIAIGRELQALNAKRPIIPIVRVNGSDPAAECTQDED